MMIVACPKCRKTFSLPEEKEGLKVKCPCGRTFTAVAKGRKTRNNSALIIIGVVAGLLLLVAVFAMSSGRSNKKKPEERSKVTRYQREPLTPFERTDTELEILAAQVLPLVEKTLGALSSGDRAALAPLLDFPAYYANERERLVSEAAEDGSECPLQPWAQISPQQREDYRTSLVRRMTNPPEVFRSWQFKNYVLDDAEPELKQATKSDGETDHDHVQVLVKMREKTWKPGSGKRKRVLKVAVHAARGAEGWLVEDLAVQVRSKGELVFRFVPNELTKRYQKMVNLGKGRAIDVTRDVESQLSESGELVHTADGEVGWAAKPRPIDFLESTPAEVRTKLKQLMTKMLDPNETTGWQQARGDLLAYKQAALPPLLSALYSYYKRAVLEVGKGDPLNDEDLGRIQKISQTLAKMREEVYQEDYMGILGFSIFEYVLPNDLAKVQRKIRSLSMFWFGWWSKHNDVVPKGEPMLPHRKKRRNKR